MSILFNEMFCWENLTNAYQATLKSDGKYKMQALKFQRNETVNLKRLQQSLYDQTYRFSGYNTFLVYEPKERVINAPHYVDKIVQLAMHSVLKQVFYPKFIRDSYSCIEGKGTHNAVNQVQKNLRKAHWEYGSDAYIVNVDVRKFFYSIDRDILKRLYRKNVKDEDVLWAMDEIINSGDLIDSVGLPLGNTLSQLCSNIYLNELDQYAKRFLKLKYYVRYADDVIAVVPNKATAIDIKQKLISFLNDRLNLQANKKKSQIYPINQGVNAFGFKIYRTHKLLRNDSKKRIKRKIKAMPRLIERNRMTVSRANQMLSSWYGHACYASSRNFVDRLLVKFDYIKLEDNTLKINEEELNAILCE